MPKIVLSEMTDADVCSWLAQTKYPTEVKDAFRGLSGDDMCELLEDWRGTEDLLPSCLSKLQIRSLQNRLSRLRSDGWDRPVGGRPPENGTADTSHGPGPTPSPAKTSAASSSSGTTTSLVPASAGSSSSLSSSPQPPHTNLAESPAAGRPPTTEQRAASAPAGPGHVAVQSFHGQTINAVVHTAPCSATPGATHTGMFGMSPEQVDPAVSQQFALYMQRYREEHKSKVEAVLTRDSISHHRGICKVCPHHNGVRFTGLNFFQFSKHFQTSEHKKHYEKQYGSQAAEQRSMPQAVTLADAARMCEAAPDWEVTVDKHGSVYVLHSLCGASLLARPQQLTPGKKQLTPKQLEHNMKQHVTGKSCARGTKKRRLDAAATTGTKVRKVMSGPLMGYMTPCDKKEYMDDVQKRPKVRAAPNPSKSGPSSSGSSSSESPHRPQEEKQRPEAQQQQQLQQPSTSAPSSSASSTSARPAHSAQPSHAPPAAGSEQSAGASASAPPESAPSPVTPPTAAEATSASSAPSSALPAPSARAAGPLLPPPTDSLMDHPGTEPAPSDLN